MPRAPAQGPALLFNNIKGYKGPAARCRRVFGNGLSSYRRVAMMLGLPPDTHPRELVKIGRNLVNEQHPAAHRQDRPGEGEHPHRRKIDLFEFPSPQWNRIDGGRYILTYGGVVTKDPVTDVMNVGVYRGMVGRPQQDPDPDVAGAACRPARHRLGGDRASRMPIAVAIGWEPTLGFVGGAPVAKGVCEYDVMGAIRGEPVDLVKCETNDLYVPATAEIVIEGYLDLDPFDLRDGRPVRRVHRLSRRRPLAQADHPRHRHHPSQRSDPARHHRGLAARQLLRERGLLVDHARRHGVERARARRRARHHRRVVPAGARRHQSAGVR